MTDSRFHPIGETESRKLARQAQAKGRQGRHVLAFELVHHREHISHGALIPITRILTFLQPISTATHCHFQRRDAS